MRRFLTAASCGLIAAIGFAIGVVSIGSLSATTISLISGPVPAADIKATLNSLINSINTCCAAGGSGTIPQALAVNGGAQTGQVRFVGSGNWSANGAVNTGLTGIGPAGSHETVQEWLTVRNASGVERYIPAF